MRKSSTSRNAVIAFFTLWMVLLGMGCAGHQGTTASLKSSSADVVRNEATIAVVTDIDRDKRVVTMKEADGKLTTVAVGDDVVLGRMDTGDKVRVDCEESLGLQLLEPGHSIDEEAYTNETLPKGVTFGRRVAATAEILAVASEGKSATFRCPDGAVHKMGVETKASRSKIARLHPGDDVQVFWTENLSVKLQR